MNPRERLQLAYELAFHPALLNDAWNRFERGTYPDMEALREAADWAAALHQRLPEAPDVPVRALRRLANHQVTSRLFRMPTVACRFRHALGIQSPLPQEVPAWLVRDISIPPLRRERGLVTTDH